MKAKLSFERFLRVEMLSYVTAKKTKELKTVDELKQLLVLEALDHTDANDAADLTQHNGFSDKLCKNI